MHTLFRKILGISGLLLFCIFCLQASAAPSLYGLMRWPQGSFRALAGDTDYLLQGHGDTLQIFDRKDHSLAGSLSLPLKEGIRAIAYAEDQKRIYLACGTEGLRIVNMENPAALSVTSYNPNPVNAGQKDASGTLIPHTFGPLGLFYLEKELYVADFMYGLRVFDVSTPEDPKEVAAYRQEPQTTDQKEQEKTEEIKQTGELKQTETTAKAEGSAGGYFQVFAHKEGVKTLVSVLDQYHGLRIFDRSAGGGNTPWKPAASYDMRSRTYYGQLSRVTGLWAEGPRAFVTDEEYGLTILHLFKESTQRDTLEIVKEGQCTIPGKTEGSQGKAADIVVDTTRQRAFIAGTAKGLSVVGLTKLFDGNPETRVQDSDLLREEGLDGLEGSLSIWQAPGNELYLASYEKGLSRITLGPPAGIAGDLPAAMDIRNVQFAEPFLILSDHGLLKGFRIMDISSMIPPDSSVTLVPPQLSEKKTEGVPMALHISGKRLFTAEGDQGIGIHDFTDPANPIHIAQIRKTQIADLENVRELLTKDHLLYCLVDQGLLILDIQTPANPVKKGLLGEFTQAAALSMENETLWVANVNELVALSLVDPASPVKTKTLPLKEAPKALWADGARVLVAGNKAGLFVHEKTSGLEAWVPLKDGASALHVFAMEDMAFVSCGEQGVQMVDLKANDGPAVVKTMDSYGNTRRGAGVGQNLYMAEGTGGLSVLRFALSEASPTPLPSVRTSSKSCFLDSLSGHFSGNASENFLDRLLK